MSRTSERPAILAALHKLTVPADAGGHRVIVLSKNDDLESAKFFIYPMSGLGEYRYNPPRSLATARVLVDILAKRAAHR